MARRSEGKGKGIWISLPNKYLFLAGFEVGQMALFLCISLPTFLFLNKGVVFKNSTSERFTYIFYKRGGILATKTQKNASGSQLSHGRCYLSKNPNFGDKYLH